MQNIVLLLLLPLHFSHILRLEGPVFQRDLAHSSLQTDRRFTTQQNWHHNIMITMYFHWYICMYSIAMWHSSPISTIVFGRIIFTIRWGRYIN